MDIEGEAVEAMSGNLIIETICEQHGVCLQYRKHPFQKKGYYIVWEGEWTWRGNRDNKEDALKLYTESIINLRKNILDSTKKLLQMNKQKEELESQIKGIRNTLDYLISIYGDEEDT